MPLSISRNAFLLLIGVVTLAAVFCIEQMQVMLAVVIVSVAIFGLLVWHYIHTRQPETPLERSEGEAVLAAGIITLFALAKMEWIVWGIGLAFIFMIHQALARIEKRMDALEKPASPKEDPE